MFINTQLWNLMFSNQHWMGLIMAKTSSYLSGKTAGISLGELRQWQTDAIDHRLTRNVLMLMVAGAKSLVQAPEQVIGGRQYFHPFAQKLTCHGIPKIAYFTHVKTAAVSVVEDFLHSWYFLKQ
jgi:hypothetical protein